MNQLSTVTNLPRFQFAIVERFNADLDQDFIDRYRGGIPAGDGSGDMTGVIRLSDGTLLNFDYTNWVEPWDRPRTEDDCPYAPYALRGWDDLHHRMFSWPSDGVVIMVLLENDQVKFWTWPGLILRNAGDHRYLEEPNYPSPPRYPGLHMAADVTKLTAEWREQLETEPEHDLGRAVVYVGHELDEFLESATQPYKFMVLRWNTELGKSQFVEYVSA